VIEKLNSDHSPNITKINCYRRPYKTAERDYNNQYRTYTVLDIKRTKWKIQTGIKSLDMNEAKLEDINEILKGAAVYKNTQHKPIKFWTIKLKTVVRLQNRARKAIRIARKNNEDTIVPYRAYKRYANKFSKLFKKAKKQYRINLIDKACQDTTGADFYKILKQNLTNRSTA